MSFFGQWLGNLTAERVYLAVCLLCVLIVGAAYSVGFATDLGQQLVWGAIGLQVVVLIIIGGFRLADE